MRAGFLLVIGFASLLGASLLTPLMARLAHAFRLVDDPGERKHHAHPIPLAGGASIVLTALIILGIVWAWFPSKGAISFWFVAAVIVICVSGVLDDCFELAPWLKALLQLFAVAPAVFWGGLQVTSLGSWLGHSPILLGAFAIPFTLICLILFINSLNLIDGMDGLAGGVAVVALAFFFVGALLEKKINVTIISLVFAASTLGFLIFNMRAPWRRQAAVFLGDAGSMMLGLVVAWCGIQLAGHPGSRYMTPMGVAWVLALPVMDTCVVMIRRLLLRRNPFMPDRLHLHHVLTDLGLTHEQATNTLLAVSAFYGAIGLVGSLLHAPQWTLFVGFMVMLVIHANFVMLAHRYASSAVGVRPEAARAR